MHSSICPTVSIELAFERRRGLSSELGFRCPCGWTSVISSNSDCNSLPINESYAWGCEVAAVGYTAAFALLTTMDIPAPDFRTFQAYEKTCKSQFEKAFVIE